MSRKCFNCRHINSCDALNCARCELRLIGTHREKLSNRVRYFFGRAAVCVLTCVSILAGIFVSLVFSARSLSVEQKYEVRQAIRVLRERGFTREAAILDNFTIFRSTDNWLNSLVPKEDAYAATNFPFQIMTLYSDFFTYPVDEIERAAVLLHEAKHLEGYDEAEAYEYVWRNRGQLGWTREHYLLSPVWRNIRAQTRIEVPALFACPLKDYGDCTE